MMNSSYKEGSDTYNLLVQNRKRLWYTLFTTFQNVSAKSDDIGITDIPMLLNQTRTKPNTSYANTKNLNVTLNSTNDEDLSADDLDAVSDTNNEDFEDASEAGSGDMAKFSDSDDENEVDNENEHLQQSRMKHIILYESDSDEFSDDGDESNEKDFIDEYLTEIRNSRIHDDNDGNDDENESDDENPPENKDLCQSQRKRTFTESGLEDGLEENPLVKKLNCQLKNVNVYINSNESDFETDSE